MHGKRTAKALRGDAPGAALTILLVTIVGACGHPSPTDGATTSAAPATTASAKSSAAVASPRTSSPVQRPTPDEPADGVWRMSDLYRAVQRDSAKYLGQPVQVRGYFIPPQGANPPRANDGPAPAATSAATDPYGRIGSAPTTSEGGLVCVRETPADVEPGAAVIASGKLARSDPDNLRLEGCELKAAGAPAPAPTAAP